MADGSAAKETAKEAFDVFAILQHQPAAVLVLDRNDRISFVNSAAEELLGSSSGQLNGLNLRALAPGSRELERLIDVARGERGRASLRGLRLDSPLASLRLERLTLAALGDGSLVAQLTNSGGESADETEFEGRELESRAAMAAVLAHEIKNPLVGVRGAVQLLEQNAAEDDRKLLKLIREEADRIRELADRLEDLSETIPPPFESLNLHEPLDRAVDIAGTGIGSGRKIERRFDPSLPKIEANRDRLTQLFLNLIANACEAVSANGVIRIETRYRLGAGPRPTDEGTSRLPIEVAVIDNGPGIPENIRDRLFEPFVSGRSGGSGLGLAICKKVAREHGGEIGFESSDGGTRLFVRLPLPRSMET